MSTVIERVKNNETTLWIPVSLSAISFAVENLELMRPVKWNVDHNCGLAEVRVIPRIFFICDPSISSFVPIFPSKYKNIKKLVSPRPTVSFESLDLTSSRYFDMDELSKVENLVKFSTFVI